MMENIDKLIEQERKRQATMHIEVNSGELEDMQKKLEDSGYVDDYDPEAHTRLADYLVRLQKGDPRGLVLIGNVGTGKTFFATRYLRCRLRHAVTVVTKYQELGYSNNFQEWLHREYHDKNVDKPPEDVILDDVGAEPVAKRYGETREVIADVIAERYTYWQKHNAKTVITSNLSKQQFDDRYGRRVTDRLAEMCITVEFNGKSARH